MKKINHADVTNTVILWPQQSPHSIQKLRPVLSFKIPNIRSDEITIFVFWRQLDLQNTFFMTVS